MSQPSAHGAARYRADELAALARALLARAGLPQDKAGDVAEVLVEGDLLGKSTHGLALLPLYLREIESGGMTTAGEPEILTISAPARPGTGASCPVPGWPAAPLPRRSPGPGASASAPSRSSAATTPPASAPISSRRSTPAA